MKTYTVIILPPVERQMYEIYRYLLEQTPQNAGRLTDAVLAAAQTLKTMPSRYPVVPRRHALGCPVRCMMCMRYRILFVVRGPIVAVLSVMHSARRVPRRLD